MADDREDASDPAAADDADAASDDAFPDPSPGESLVPVDAVQPLANAVVFAVAWGALLLYVGRGPVQAVGLGLVGGAIYFVAAYYLL